ncbi:MAG: hypothetical protein K0R54_3337 [Clostridiaceae bacterium]|jgi:hypothetical protein|nr:hypothetical protein [Clostridiaceae bacterium]
MDKEILIALSSLFDEKIDPIKKDIPGLKKNVKFINAKQQEHDRILKILEEETLFNSNEHDKMPNNK